jgi:hypothetical protein
MSAPPKVYLPKDDARDHAKMYYNKLVDDVQVLTGDFFDDLARSCAKKPPALACFLKTLEEKREMVEERFNAYFERYGGEEIERTYRNYVEALSRLISKSQKQKRDEGAEGDDLVYAVMDYDRFMHTLFKRVVHTASTNARFYFEDVKPFKWEMLYVKTVSGVLRSIIPQAVSAPPAPAPAPEETPAPAPPAPAQPARPAPPGSEQPPDTQWNGTPNLSHPPQSRRPRLAIDDKSSDDLWR